MNISTLILTCAPLVHPDTMTGIIQVESGGNPYAIAALDRSFYPESKAEATEMVKVLQSKKIPFAAGLAQIYHTNFKRLGLNAENVFDPCTNIKAGQTVLHEAYSQRLLKTKTSSTALGEALSIYNSGNISTGFNNGYVSKVTTNGALKVPSVKILDQSLAADTDTVQEATLDTSGSGSQELNVFDRALEITGSSPVAEESTVDEAQPISVTEEPKKNANEGFDDGFAENFKDGFIPGKKKLPTADTDISSGVYVATPKGGISDYIPQDSIFYNPVTPTSNDF